MRKIRDGAAVGEEQKSGLPPPNRRKNKHTRNEYPTDKPRRDDENPNRRATDARLYRGVSMRKNVRKIRDGAAVGEEQKSGLPSPNRRKNKYTRNERPTDKPRRDDENPNRRATDARLYRGVSMRKNVRKIRDGAAVGEEQKSGLPPPNLRKNKYTRNERPTDKPRRDDENPNRRATDARLYRGVSMRKNVRKIRDGAAVGEEQKSGLPPPNLRKNKYTRNERPTDKPRRDDENPNRRATDARLYRGVSMRKNVRKIRDGAAVGEEQKSGLPPPNLRENKHTRNECPTDKPRRDDDDPNRHATVVSTQRHTYERTTHAHTGKSYWIYGWHSVDAALRNPDRRCLRLCLTGEVAEKAQERLALQACADAIQMQIVSLSGLRDCVPGDAVHQGVALQVLPLPVRELQSFLDLVVGRASGPVGTSSEVVGAGSEASTGSSGVSNGRRIVAVLDRVTDPRNVGAIVRNAAAFGLSGLVVLKRGSPPESGSLAKAASGALETVPIVRVANLSRALERLAEAGFWRICMDPSAHDTLVEADKPESHLAVLFGAEDKGCRPLVRRHCDTWARVPLRPLFAEFDTLNVSAAAAATFALLTSR